MYGYAVNIVFRRKLRTFLTSLGITISVVLLSLIIFGMRGLSDVITDELNARFLPNQVSLSSQDFFGGFGGGSPTAREDEGEPTILTPEVVSEIAEVEYVDRVDPIIVVQGLEIDLVDSDISPFSPAFIGGIDTAENKSYILDVVAEQFTPGPGEAFVGNIVTDYYGLTPEEVIGKEIVLQPSTSGFFNQRSSSILDKEFRYTVTGFIDTGADRFDVMLGLEETVAVAADIGGFESPEQYINAFGYDQVFVDLESEERVEEFKDFLDENYNLFVLTSDDILDLIDQVTVVLTLGLTFFGIISAFVASIGIINTMVMSIYEQTREIGIIKAIGASDLQVMIVFLIQAGLIGLIGGLLGVILVILIMVSSDPFIVEALQAEGLTPDSFFTVDPLIVIAIILASITVGVLAGLYPALKAARLDPVNALRYE